MSFQRRFGANLLRGFTLLETMVVVVILGVFSTMAVASLIPSVRRAELGAGTDNVLAVVTRARFAAMATRRCTQVLFLPAAADQAQVMLLRELNTLDCDGPTTGQTQTMASAPRLDPSQGLWIERDRVSFDDDDVRVTFVSHPPSLTDAEGGDCPVDLSPCPELRFRPSGRVWSPDDNLDNDDVTIEVRHSQVADVQRFVIDGAGAFEVLPGGH